MPHPIVIQNLQPVSNIGILAALRIVSLVPSQTELLFDLGLNEAVVGITKFCIHPQHWRTEKIIVGGTKNIHINRIKELAPTLIIANKEENTEAIVQACSHVAPVWVSDISSLNDALDMITSIGTLTNTVTKATQIANAIAYNFNMLSLPTRHYNTAYFIWRKPYMAAGGDTFINAMLSAAGLKNAFAHMPRYPEVTLEHLTVNEVDLILLSSEPYPFKASHIAEIQTALPNAIIRLVDGEMFSWYGSRLLQTTAYLQRLLADL